MRTYLAAVAACFSLLLFSELLSSTAVAEEKTASETAAPTASAEQKAMMEAWMKKAAPGLEHEKLADLAGTWSVTTKMWMDPTKPPEVGKGTAVRTMILGGRVLEERFGGPGMGGSPPFDGLGHTGYDNVTGQYWSTWTDNMMTGVAVLYGNWDETGRIWVFEGKAPDPMTGKLIPMRTESRTDESGRENNEFYQPGPDGQMIKTMELIYERQ